MTQCLVPEGAARLTEYGKRFMSSRMEQVDRFWDTVHDVVKLAHAEARKWADIEAALKEEGCPTAISSGLSGYSMLKLLDHNNGKTSFTMPASVAMALGTSAPTVATTGNWGAAETGSYAGYARLGVSTSAWTPASGTNPAAATYCGSGAVTFAGCTASSATQTGFILVDSGVIGSGNALWYGGLSSVTISTTQTPPTLAQNALTVQLNGT
jgi:hypothetical protein